MAPIVNCVLGHACFVSLHIVVGYLSPGTLWSSRERQAIVPSFTPIAIGHRQMMFLPSPPSPTGPSSAPARHQLLHIALAALQECDNDHTWLPLPYLLQEDVIAALRTYSKTHSSLRPARAPSTAASIHHTAKASTSNVPAQRCTAAWASMRKSGGAQQAASCLSSEQLLRNRAAAILGTLAGEGPEGDRAKQAGGLACIAPQAVHQHGPLL